MDLARRYTGHETLERILGINDDPLQIAETRRFVDALGRLWKVLTPAGGADAVYDHDLLGSLTSADLDGQVRTFASDALGQLRSRTEPESGTTTFELYDPRGNLVKSTDSRGTTLLRELDAAGRLERLYSVHGAGQRLLKELRYDEEGRGNWATGKLTTKISPNAVSEELHYDGLSGRLSKTVQSLGGLQLETRFGYGPLGAMEKLEYPHEIGQPPALTVDFGFTWGLLRTVAAGQQDVLTNVRYAPHGGALLISHGNHTETLVVPDMRGRTESITVTNAAAATVWRSGTHAYDGAGNIIEIGRADEVPAPDVASSFGYDLHGRLSSAVFGLGQSRSLTYSYDTWGNMTTRTHDDGSGNPCAPTPSFGGMLSFAGREYQMGPGSVPGTDVTNRISELAAACYPGASVAYDDAGNMTQDQFGTYVHDDLNRLGVATPFGAPAVTSAYDTDDRRVLKASAVETRWYVRGPGGQTLAEYVGATSPVLDKQLVHALGRLVAEVEEASPAPVWTWHHHDHLSSTRLVTDMSGLAVNAKRLDFTPFGAEMPDIDGACAEGRYALHERDGDTGLTYMLARYQSPWHGRFLQVDPLARSARLAEPASFNRFSFAADSPLTFLDPDGRKVVFSEAFTKKERKSLNMAVKKLMEVDSFKARYKRLQTSSDVLVTFKPEPRLPQIGSADGSYAHTMGATQLLNTESMGKGKPMRSTEMDILLDFDNMGWALREQLEEGVEGDDLHGGLRECVAHEVFHADTASTDAGQTTADTHEDDAKEYGHTVYLGVKWGRRDAAKRFQ